MKTPIWVILITALFIKASTPFTFDPLIKDKTIAQVAIVVKDIEKASTHWATVLGVEKPTANITGHSEARPTMFKGQPSDAKAKLAFIQLENLQIELIEPMGGNSTWQEFLDNHGEGVHHIAFWVQDINGLEKKFEVAGMPVAQSGGWDGGGYSYIDATEQLGTYVELLENFNP